MKSILSDEFKYTPSYATDISKLFERKRKELREIKFRIQQELHRSNNVMQFKEKHHD